jgi:hypothetical protein
MPDKTGARSVAAEVNYLGPMHERPVFYAEAVEKNNLNLVSRQVTVSDFRPRRDEAAIATTGFQLVDHPTAVRDFADPDQIDCIYIPEIRELIASLTGAARVEATRPVLRWSEKERHPEHVNSRPGRFAHVDYNRGSFHGFARNYLAGDPEAERWLAGRYAAFNIWRVMSQPPQDIPLGFIDRRTTRIEDVVDGDAVIDAPGRPEFRFTSSLYRASARHRWGYFSDMRPDEAVVFLGYDSADDSLPGAPHSAFDDPGCPAGAPPRASCEIRAFAFWG